MPFYTSEQILNQAFDSGSQSLKTGGGTAAEPGTDVQTVQEAQLVTSSVLSTSGQTHVALCSGMSEVVFRIYDNAGGPGVAPSSTTVLAEGWHSAHGAEGTNANWVPLRVIQDSSLAGDTRFIENAVGSINPNTWHPNQYIASCVGFEKVRIRLAGSPASAYKVISAVHPSSNRVSRMVTAKLLCDVSTTSTSQVQPLYTYTINNTAVYYTDTTTPLAANALFIGSTRAMLAGNNKFNSLAVSDLGSTTNGFFTQGSTDVGTTWRNHKLLTMPASDPTPSEVQRTVNSYRIGFQNGVSAQTFFSLTSSQTPN